MILGPEITTTLCELIFTISMVYFMLWKYQRRRLYKLAENIPGPPGLPLLGNAIQFLDDPNPIFNNLVSLSVKYKNVFKTWIGPRLLIFVTNPADIELILSSSEHIDKAPEYRFFEPWLGQGLLITTGEKWRLHRKLIAPTFHMNVLKSFFGLFNKNSRNVVEKLKNEVDKTIDCHDYLSEATVETLIQTVMGVHENTTKGGYEYAMAVMKMCDILHLRHTKLWLRCELLFKLSGYKGMQNKLLATIHGLTQKVYNIRKSEYIENGNSFGTKVDTEEHSEQEFSFVRKDIKDDLDEDIGEKKRLAFLDLLIEGSENGVCLTDEEVQNQVDTIMFEGHDTTAAGTSFFLCMMAARPDIQEKIIEELDKIYGNSNRDITFQDTLEMKYLERCIMETLRLYPPVPAIARELQTEITLVSENITIPAKSTVVIGTYRTHRRADVYENPETFNPDNFLPENSAKRHYYSYIPFSAGPRSCVGRKYAMLKMKVILAYILRNFKVKPGLKEDEWKLQADIILKRSDGFRVTLESRANSAL